MQIFATDGGIWFEESKGDGHFDEENHESEVGESVVDAVWEVEAEPDEYVAGEEGPFEEKEGSKSKNGGQHVK